MGETPRHSQESFDRPIVIAGRKTIDYLTSIERNFPQRLIVFYIIHSCVFPGTNCKRF